MQSRIEAPGHADTIYESASCGLAQAGRSALKLNVPKCSMTRLAIPASNFYRPGRLYYTTMYQHRICLNAKR